MSRSTILFLVITMAVGGCTSKGQSQLSKALSAAVKENKISGEKMESILKEYDFVREEDKTKAREYLVQVLNAIEMGGDSSHIDVARKQVLERLKPKAKV